MTEILHHMSKRALEAWRWHSGPMDHGGMARTRSAPTVGQGIFGMAVLLAFALITTWWALSETGGSRTFLLLLSAMFFILAALRGLTTFLLAKKRVTPR